MADLKSSVISSEIKSAPDYLFYGKTMPNNTNVDSAEKLLGGTQDSLEVVVIAATEIALADTKVLTIILQKATAKGGSYSTVSTLYTKTASGAETIAAGTELARYTINRIDGLWFKLNIATTDTQESGTITAYPAYVSR